MAIFREQSEIVTGMLLSDSGRIFLKGDIQHESGDGFLLTSAVLWRLSAAHLRWASWNSKGVTPIRMEWYPYCNPSGYCPQFLMR